MYVNEWKEVNRKALMVKYWKLFSFDYVSQINAAFSVKLLIGRRNTNKETPDWIFFIAELVDVRGFST